MASDSVTTTAKPCFAVRLCAELKRLAVLVILGGLLIIAGKYYGFDRLDEEIRSRIESRLGVRLIERSTRKLRLTAEGELYRERAESILGDLDALEAEVVGGAHALTGLIRQSYALIKSAAFADPHVGKDA